MTQIKGYTKPSEEQLQLQLVNENKVMEERILRRLDELDVAHWRAGDKRWLSIARTHIEQGFMCMNRAIMRPERIDLRSEDER